MNHETAAIPDTILPTVKRIPRSCFLLYTGKYFYSLHFLTSALVQKKMSEPSTVEESAPICKKRGGGANK